MPEHPTTFDDHEPLALPILKVLEDFIDEIGARGCTGHFDKVVDGKYYLKGKHLIQTPERFIEDELVFPMLREALGYSLRPQPKQYAPRWPRSGGIPDFAITSLPVNIAMQNDVRFFGEVKPPKKIKNARNDMKEYLDSDLEVHAVALLTDGFEWELWFRQKGEAFSEKDKPYAEASIRDSLRTVQSRNKVTEPYQPHQVRMDIDTEGFSAFTVDSVLTTIEEKFDVKTV